MKKVVLSSGLTIISKKTNSNSVTLGICVKTGSNNEDKHNKGISHFIEHMVFEGTEKRTAQELVREIEKVGGEFNAFTDNEITFYYAKVLGKYFDKALNVLGDMLKNSVFDEKLIAVIDTGKEKLLESLKQKQAILQKEYFELHL